MLTYNYHGWRAGLNARGAAPTLQEPAVGLQDLTNGKINAVGVPVNHTGDYITFLQNNNRKIIRTMNDVYNLQNGVIDLGKIITDFKSDASLTVPNVGIFFYNFVNSVQAPCDGICFDFEFNPLNNVLYPKTSKDQELCYYWYTSLYPESNLVNFRCKQFSTIFRLMIHLLKKFRFPAMDTNIVYSGYDGLLYSGDDIRKHYGCNFSFLTSYISWRSISLPKPTHAQCAWHTTIDLPVEAVDRILLFPLSIIHNICLSPTLHSRDNIALQIKNRIGMLRNCDTIGTVEQGYPNYPVYVWNQENKMVCEEMGKQI